VGRTVLRKRKERYCRDDGEEESRILVPEEIEVVGKSRSCRCDRKSGESEVMSLK
jgi:hypothetical protein